MTSHQYSSNSHVHTFYQHSSAWGISVFLDSCYGFFLCRTRGLSWTMKAWIVTPAIVTSSLSVWRDYHSSPWNSIQLLPTQFESWCISTYEFWPFAVACTCFVAWGILTINDKLMTYEGGNHKALALLQDDSMNALSSAFPSFQIYISSLSTHLAISARVLPP